MSNIILHSGGYRTGSTLGFNISRLLHEMNHINSDSNQYGLVELMQLSKANPDTVYNIKLHDHIPKEPMKIICTYRNPFDVAASWYAIHLRETKGATQYNFGCSHVVETMADHMDKLRNVRDSKKDVLMVSYQDLLTIKNAIEQIAKYVGVSCSEDIKKTIASNLDIENVRKQTDTVHSKEADRINQYRGHHISHLTIGQNGGYKYLSEELQEALEKEFGPYNEWCLENI